jgi:hypothetical protein
MVHMLAAAANSRAAKQQHAGGEEATAMDNELAAVEPWGTGVEEGGAMEERRGAMRQQQQRARTLVKGLGFLSPFSYYLHPSVSLGLGMLELPDPVRSLPRLQVLFTDCITDCTTH